MSDDAKRASTESADSAPSPSSTRNVVTAAPVERESRDSLIDGAAGVMYTSFLGLILDDLIALGTGKYKKC